jgi:hypothetical protein
MVSKGRGCEQMLILELVDELMSGLLLTGSYTQISEAAYEFVATHDQDDSIPHRGINLNYRNVVFMYHDKRRALNKPPSGSRRGESEESPSSSCYFSLHAIKSYFQEHNQAAISLEWN